MSDVMTGRLPVHGHGGTTLLKHWRGGPRTLHGFYSNGFPNLFHLGSLQNATSAAPDSSNRPRTPSRRG